MISTAQKYNVTISMMRASKDHRLEMPAFHHPYAKKTYLQINSKSMKCLQDNHKTKTVNDLIHVISKDRLSPTYKCPERNHGKCGCKSKATELLSRLDDSCNPKKETPQRHNLWHTQRRIEKYSNADPSTSKVLFNPDTRSKHCLLGSIRIFGKTPGYKSNDRNLFMRTKTPARIDQHEAPTGRKTSIITDGSTIRNGWENASAGIGVWYNDDSRRNVPLKLNNDKNNTVSNTRAELGAILEALRQNETDDLEIESDSLSSLRAICTHSGKYEDLDWLGIKNKALLKGILIRLRTRPAKPRSNG